MRYWSLGLGIAQSAFLFDTLPDYCVRTTTPLQSDLSALAGVPRRPSPLTQHSATHPSHPYPSYRCPPLSEKQTYQLVVLIRQPAILPVLPLCLLLQRVKVPALSTLSFKLLFELLDRLAELFRLAIGARLLGRLLLQSSEGFLNVDKVEDDVKDAGEEKGEEEGGAGEVD